MISYPFDGLPEPGSSMELAPGVRWVRMPLPMALDHINLYLLEDDAGWWVVDTGIAPGDTEALWRRIFETELGGKPVIAVLATHYHPDHTGMAGWLCDHWRAPLYMTRSEYLTGRVFGRPDDGQDSWTLEQYFRRAGMSDAMIAQARQRFRGFSDLVRPMPASYRRLRDGDQLRIGGCSWRVVVGSGHSPEHACLYSEAHNILISGDQVIPRISSNISVWGVEPEANPLRDWLESLERLLSLLPADALVLPAHNEPFRGLHPRLRDLIEHHEGHLLALEEACCSAEPTALELLPVMFSRSLDQQQLGMALGECVAHLNYLSQRGQLQRIQDGDGRYRYRSIDDSLPQRLRRQRHRAEQGPPVQV